MEAPVHERMRSSVTHSMCDLSSSEMPELMSESSRWF